MSVTPQPPSQPRTTPEKVRGVMDLDSSEWSNVRLQEEIEDAHLLVEQRLTPHVDTTKEAIQYALYRVETYVAAHMLYPAVTGLADGGDVVSSMTELDVTKELETGHLSDPEFVAGPNGMQSPFWGKALQLDPTDGRLAHPSRDPEIVHIR